MFEIFFAPPPLLKLLKKVYQNASNNIKVKDKASYTMMKDKKRCGKAHRAFQFRLCF
jgi:hypothetical protein